MPARSEPESVPVVQGEIRSAAHYLKRHPVAVVVSEQCRGLFALPLNENEAAIWLFQVPEIVGWIERSDPGQVDHKLGVRLVASHVLAAARRRPAN